MTISRIESQYVRWLAVLQRKCKWDRIPDLLLHNNGLYLQFIKRMSNGGILFGCDEQNNPLVAGDGDRNVFEYKPIERRISLE